MDLEIRVKMLKEKTKGSNKAVRDFSAAVSKHYKIGRGDAGAGLCWREAHLIAKAPWMSPRPGEDEAR